MTYINIFYVAKNSEWPISWPKKCVFVINYQTDIFNFLKIEKWYTNLSYLIFLTGKKIKIESTS